MPQISRVSPSNRTPIRKDLKTGIVSRISPIGFDDEEGIKILLYGRSGTGKTTLWATFPAPILAIICSGGKKPGETRSIDTPENRKRISSVTPDSVAELKELIEHLEDDQRFKTVVLDHATGLQDTALAGILGLDELPAQKSWGLASQQQYAQCTLQCKDTLRDLLSLSCNVVVIAQEREFNNEPDNELISPTVGAGLTPSLTGWLNTAVDYICQTFIRQKEEVKVLGEGKNARNVVKKLKEVEFCLRTAPDPVYTTKFRTPKGANRPPEIVDPSYEKILDLING